MDNKIEEYDSEGNAKHYGNNRVNVMEILERAYGTEYTMIFCEMNALKYRFRIGEKKSQDIDLELKKIKWYENAAKYYHAKLNLEQEYIPKINNHKIDLPWKN